VQLVRYLQDAPAAFPDLRYLTNTGGAIPKPILEAMPRLFAGAEIYLMYGLTEAFRSTYLPPEMFATKMGAIGRAIPNVEILVVHPETGLCGPNEIGELIHRGDLVSLGYWQQPEATAARIRSNNHLKSLIADEIVVHSGDWVRRDEDGVLWYVGRMDSMIKCSGYRISPTEIEEIACRMSGIDHAVAFGVPDDELGQTVHLAVQWQGPEADEAALMKFFRQSSPSYMWPRTVYIQQSAMPRTSSGKIDREAVIASCRNPDLGQARGPEGDL
jgi:acyl-CoA synthetase (AMP-forming)/AMP-acid ligase II